MCDIVLLHQYLERLVVEVAATIANDNSRSSKPSENHILEKIQNNLVIISSVAAASTHLDT